MFSQKEALASQGSFQAGLPVSRMIIRLARTHLDISPLNSCIFFIICKYIIFLVFLEVGGQNLESAVGMRPGTFRLTSYAQGAGVPSSLVDMS